MIKHYLKRATSLGLIAISMLAAGLNACSGYSTAKVKNPQYVVSPDDVTVRLAEAADRASRSLEALAAVEQADNPDVTIASIPNAPQELRRTITLDWYGPVEQVAQDVADRASYEFKAFGNAPPTPVIVAIRAENRQVIDVLRDIGLQLGTLANVRVDAQRRVIELYYPSALEDPAKGV